MDSSILDRYFIESLSPDSSKRSKKNSLTDEMSEEFRQFFENFTARQKNTQAFLQSHSARFANGQTDAERMNDIIVKLQEYFSEEEALSDNLLITYKWFSEGEGVAASFLNRLEHITGSNPDEAARSLRGLFRSRQVMSNALEEAGMQDSVYFSSVSGLNYSDGAEEGKVGSLSFASMQLDIKLREVRTMNSGMSYFQTDNGFDMSSFQRVHSDQRWQASFSFDASSAITSLGSSSTTTMKINAMIQLLDPLVLDLDGDGVNLKDVSDGVMFDLRGDGQKVRCGFVQGDDALLFLDENGDSVCTDGKELFGDQQGHTHGFAELATHDSNHDGVIDQDDSVYKDLKVWNDYNGDGVSQVNEVRSLSDAGVESISLGYRNTDDENNGNFISQQGFFRRFDGALRSIVDAQFAYHEVVRSYRDL